MAHQLGDKTLFSLVIPHLDIASVLQLLNKNHSKLMKPHFPVCLPAKYSLQSCISAGVR